MRDFVKEETGMALVFAISVIFLLTSILLALMSLSQTHSKVNWYFEDESQCLYLAESALDMALVEYQEDDSGTRPKTRQGWFVVDGDTVGEYRYRIIPAGVDTLVGIGYIPNATFYRIRKEVRMAISKESEEKENHKRKKKHKRENDCDEE